MPCLSQRYLAPPFICSIHYCDRYRANLIATAANPQHWVKEYAVSSLNSNWKKYKLVSFKTLIETGELAIGCERPGGGDGAGGVVGAVWGAR